ncbi:ABC transporter ATP-binding protein [Limimaricola cinnabarinus]|uniref:Spermidine/putrescine import ATP-binding protein PotA n=1 Tax=Limimaricola cinnabarinus TaxID=1125964 RepID=A0A2G1MG44_9RHOB|nr:ABC transporter ATP-binding protein [Limimaricola cinnabarinus]PHP27630.1 polyamine ABC transporter ATP-binding protein [Limimaricola cinnabarinus]
MTELSTATTPAVPPWADPEAQPFLRLDGVSKSFGGFEAVRGVTLDIYRGELFCLLGGSGCGKSTLLRMLAGFETPSAGRVLIDGEDQAGRAPHDRPTNMMFQSYALFPHMSVEKNIAYGLKRDGLPRAEIAARVADILALVQMTPFARRKPDQLSGGQRQRVALARALVKRPKLLLLDEPLGALDRKLREETQFELKKIQAEVGITFVVVTHDQEEAMTLSSRIGVMNAGEIVQVGTPHEIYEQPHSRFVANFIGSVNCIEGRVTGREGGHLRIACPDLGAEVTVESGFEAGAGEKVALALRPEKIAMGRTARPGFENMVTGRVEEVAYMGNLTIFQLRTDGGARLRVTQSNTTRTDADVPRIGENVQLQWTGAAGFVLGA